MWTLLSQRPLATPDVAPLGWLHRVSEQVDRKRLLDGVRAGISGNVALGRVGEPDDIGRTVVALVSHEMGWVTGQRIEASGGTQL